LAIRNIIRIIALNLIDMDEKVITVFASKLAKIKGFDWKTPYFYDEKNQLRTCSDEYKSASNNLTESNSFSFNANGKDKFIMSAPTQGHLQKWLRDNHKIDVIVSPATIDTDAYICTIYEQWLPNDGNIDKKIKVTIIKDDNRKIITWKHYEAALEYGLEKALTLIK
jgi:hypothetical protein